jgi:hypothetical protein
MVKEGEQIMEISSFTELEAQAQLLKGYCMALQMPVHTILIVLMIVSHVM